MSLTQTPMSDPSTFTASDHAHDGKAHLLLACTGSVATIKLPEILRALSVHEPSLSIRVLLTSHARPFLAGEAGSQAPWKALTSIPCVNGVYVDEDEWAVPWTRGAPILHIELRRWAHLLVVAPLSADALARMVHGRTNDLLGCVLRAWDIRGVEPGWNGRRKQVVVAPAMNTEMWLHPVAESQLHVLEHEWAQCSRQGHAESWIEVLRPVEKTLACGDVGVGAMREWTEIVSIIELKLGFATAGVQPQPKAEAEHS